MDPGPFFYIAITVYLLLAFANYYLLPLNTLNSLFTANRWDWQPHCKLGQSTWLCCVQVPRCCWCKPTPWTSFLSPLSGTIAKLAGINLLMFGSFSYWFDKPWFHNGGKTCCCAHHNLLLGFPTGRSYIKLLHQHRTTTPLRVSFGLRFVSEKIGTSGFVSSNSKNISSVTFLKHKNSRKQGTGTMASR
jgi:hypothetical protein